jgi:YfiH family protein
LGESLLRQDSNRLVTYRFESLAVEGLVHAVFTRLGGASRGPFATLNVGHTVGDDETAVAENHARIFSHLGLTCDRVVTARQVHGNRVAVVTAGDAGRVIPTTDGLVTDTPGLALMLRFADCQPILLYDPVHHALGLIHAGWRGVAEGIAYRAVETMQAAFGSRPQELLAGLGPAIGSCCYTVGHKVAAVMGYALPDWSQVMSLEGEGQWRFDLPAANAQQLAAAGVQAIEQAHLCTGCHGDEFFSHRADNGQTGRFAVVAYLEARGKEQGNVSSQNVEATLAVARQGQEQALPPPQFLDSLDPPGFPTFEELQGAAALGGLGGRP